MAKTKVAIPTTDVFADVIKWYQERLSLPAVRPSLPPNDKGESREAVYIGPTWQKTAQGFWKLPDATLGWSVLGWCGQWLQHEPGKPWRFTMEQARFILWWYALDERGRFLYRDAVLQRLKGWGKDPLGACLCAVELLGPARFADWAPGGKPLAKDVGNAWVQTAAVALEQTKNTMILFPTLFTADAIREYGIQIGKETLHALNDSRTMTALTSSPAKLEGARATFLLANETQHWTKSNGGLDMAAVIGRNAAKSPDGAARTLRITNAYEPSQDSVAQRDRDSWVSQQSGKSLSVGMLYDSVEAPPDAKLTIEEAPSVIEAIRGDSVWLNTDRIVQEITDLRNPPSSSRRFWYNQIVATEDAWVSPNEWDMCSKPETELHDGDEITIFLDLSKTDDATALSGCRLSDGFQL